MDSCSRHHRLGRLSWHASTGGAAAGTDRFIALTHCLLALLVQPRAACRRRRASNSGRVKRGGQLQRRGDDRPASLGLCSLQLTTLLSTRIGLQTSKRAHK
jgi:hypothetical protein